MEKSKLHKLLGIELDEDYNIYDILQLSRIDGLTKTQAAKDYMERAIQTLHNWQAPRIVQVWDAHYAYLRKRELVFDQPSKNVELDIELHVEIHKIALRLRVQSLYHDNFQLT